MLKYICIFLRILNYQNVSFNLHEPANEAFLRHLIHLMD